MSERCVGVVERSRIVDGSAIRPGDVVVGLESSGLHSNGFSLVRKAVFEARNLKINAHVPELGLSVAQLLLAPTRIYVRPLLDLLGREQRKPAIHGLAHVTGGAAADNPLCSTWLGWSVPACWQGIQAPLSGDVNQNICGIGANCDQRGGTGATPRKPRKREHDAVGCGSRSSPSRSPPARIRSWVCRPTRSLARSP